MQCFFEPWLPCLLPDFKKFRRWEQEQKTITLRGEARNYCCLLLEHVTDLRLVGRKIAKKTNIQRRLLRKVNDFLSKTSVAAVAPVVLLACQQGSCWWLTGYGGKYWWSEGLLVDLVARSKSFPPMGHCEHRQKHHERVAFETAQKKAPGALESLVLEPIDLVVQCLFSRPM